MPKTLIGIKQFTYWVSILVQVGINLLSVYICTGKNLSIVYTWAGRVYLLSSFLYNARGKLSPMMVELYIASPHTAPIRWNMGLSSNDWNKNRPVHYTQTLITNIGQIYIRYLWSIQISSTCICCNPFIRKIWKSSAEYLPHLIHSTKLYMIHRKYSKGSIEMNFIEKSMHSPVKSYFWVEPLKPGFFKEFKHSILGVKDFFHQQQKEFLYKE